MAMHMPSPCICDAAHQRSAAALEMPARQLPRYRPASHRQVRRSAASQTAQSPSQMADQSRQIRICVNKTCKKQGSQQIAKFGQDLGLEEFHITTTGCLGECGSGPNVVIMPHGDAEAQLLSHVSTPAKFREALQLFCGVHVPDVLLKATELRLAGNMEARDGNLRGALRCYSEALELNPPRGQHLLYANRSGVKLALGDAAGAVQDGQQAVEKAPAGFTTAFIRLIEAHGALEQYHEASDALDQAVSHNPGFEQHPDCKNLRKQLKQVLR